MSEFGIDLRIIFENHPGFFPDAGEVAAPSDLINRTESINLYFNQVLHNHLFTLEHESSLTNEIIAINASIGFISHTDLIDRLRRVFNIINEASKALDLKHNQLDHFNRNKACRVTILQVCGHLLRLPTLQNAQA
jgi:hypothetical protein